MYFIYLSIYLHDGNPYLFLSLLFIELIIGFLFALFAFLLLKNLFIINRGINIILVIILIINFIIFVSLFSLFNLFVPTT